jgi:hypothetical protein
LVLATVAAALVAGVFTFPQALEPGRSDRDGITLMAALGTGDWFSGSPGVEIRPLPGGRLSLRKPERGRLLITRGLPVDPDACYTAFVRARAETPRVTIALYDEDVQELLAEDGVPRTARPATHDVRFDPDGRARVTFAVIGGGAAARATIDQLRLVRREC